MSKPRLKEVKQLTKYYIARKKQSLDLNSDVIFYIFLIIKVFSLAVMKYRDQKHHIKETICFVLRLPRKSPQHWGSHGSSQPEQELRDHIFHCRKVAVTASRKWDDAIAPPSQNHLSDALSPARLYLLKVPYPLGVAPIRKCPHG